MPFVAIKMGRRQGARRAHPAPLSTPGTLGLYGSMKVGRDVTDEQRSRRPIFIATLRAGASWLFFRVACSSRIDSDMLVARALKNSQLTCGERHAISGTGHYFDCFFFRAISAITEGSKRCSAAWIRACSRSAVSSANIGTVRWPRISPVSTPAST
jgi:hypothetical protein